MSDRTSTKPAPISDKPGETYVVSKQADQAKPSPEHPRMWEARLILRALDLDVVAALVLLFSYKLAFLFRTLFTAAASAAALVIYTRFFSASPPALYDQLAAIRSFAPPLIAGSALANAVVSIAGLFATIFTVRGYALGQGKMAGEGGLNTALQRAWWLDAIDKFGNAVACTLSPALGLSALSYVGSHTWVGIPVAAPQGMTVDSALVAGLVGTAVTAADMLLTR